MENQTTIFSQFVKLHYNFKNNSNNIVYPSKLSFSNKINKRFKQILETSSLYAATFEEVNDIDECTYSSPENVSIYREKSSQLICCFSFDKQKNNIETNECDKNNKFEEDLMWAHYANGCLGVRINFKIPKQYSIEEDTETKIVFPVQYDDELLTVNNQYDAVKSIIDIMTRKKKCWSYEQEYRAVFHEPLFYDKDKQYRVPENRFPIIISEIILGRKFCKINAPFSENKQHIQGIAKQIKNILVKSGKYREDNLPEIKAYRKRYENTPDWKPLEEN